MSVDLTGFNANEVEAKKDFQLLPEDDYVVAITESGMEPTKANTGHFMKLALQVTQGKFKGSTAYDRLNLDNPNAKAVEIAKATLSSICRAVGVMQPKSSAELHNREMIARIAVVKREDKPGEFSNEVKNYYPMGSRATGQNANGVVPQSQPAAQQSAPVNTQSATNGAAVANKPWLNK